MRLLAIPSPTHVAVWEECYWRWCSLSELATRSSLDPTEEGPLPNGDKSLTTEVFASATTVRIALTFSQQRQAQWHNLTLFLASFGSVCLGEAHDSSALAAVIPTRYLPDQLRVLRDPTELLSSFITQLINLLLADSTQARDLAREALSAEAHPRLYPRILRELDL